MLTPTFEILYLYMSKVNYFFIHYNIKGTLSLHAWIIGHVLPSSDPTFKKLILKKKDSDLALKVILEGC